MRIVFHLLCLILLLSCDGNKQQKAVASLQSAPSEQKESPQFVDGVRFKMENSGREFTYGEELKGELKVDGELGVDSIVCYWDNKRILTTSSGEFRFRIPEEKTGKRILKLVAFHPGNKQSIVTQSVIVRPDKAPHKYNYEVVKVYKHDPKAYTQGLVYQDGFMYEGTGQHGFSSVRKVDLATNEILSVLSIDNKYFGEGITIYKDKIYQITWQSHIGFVYDLKTFSRESTFSYNSQGWGITTVGNKLIMSDGSNKLYHIAPESFGVMKEVEVYDNAGTVENLNELEYINGLIWANVWLTDRIVLIDPETGAVRGELDLSKLLPASDRNKLDKDDDVLNGIAYNPKNGTVFLTGKRWPKMFEIKILD